VTELSSPIMQEKTTQTCESLHSGRLECLVDEYIQASSIYDLFKCSCCGLSWPEHQDSCVFHRKKQYFSELRQIASRMEKYKSVFDMARMNGCEL
jgi:hypothetical protein